MFDEAAPKLVDHWLRDQSIAFAATLLGEYEPTMFEPRQWACAKLLSENMTTIQSGIVSDSTVSLVSTIDPLFFDEEFLLAGGFRDLGEVAPLLGTAVSAARDELRKRDAISAKGLNRVLISHSVYVLKRRNMPAVKFLKWLHRAAPGAVPGMQKVLTGLHNTGPEIIELLESALAASRDPDQQTRDRLDEIDNFFELVLRAAGSESDKVHPWWSRICMAYRSSLFCWPLLTEGSSDQSDERKATNEPEVELGSEPTGRGLSLPISLFLLEDGKSSWRNSANSYGQKIWFKYKLSKAEEELRDEPRFRAIEDDIPAHMSGFRFGFTQQWWNAFAIGVDVAKKLWSSQNGRLRFADAQAAQRKRESSLNVDLRAACDIVESVYSLVPEKKWAELERRYQFFTVADRSAEAYWVQCVLGLLLPAREVPMGLCTGRIEYLQGEFEMQDVGGIVSKLEYANRAGVPRVVIPGDRREFYDTDQKVEVRDDVKAFLERLEAYGSMKTFEVNFARTARAAADAMQPSGWRRANFMRTVGFQRSFGHHQRRLFLRDSLNDDKLKRKLKKKEVDWYNDHRKWFDIETKQLEQLDSVILSGANRSVKYVYGNQLMGKVPGVSIEETLGKWVAWSDNKVRNGEDTGYRGPGLGVLTLRTAEGDHEIRLWSALAELLDADDAWWERFQWSDLPQSAKLLAQLLCNQRADPSISVGSAPDLLIVFDDAGMTQTRTNMVFPNNFHHQFFDLLNPRHPENRKPDFLDAALKQHGEGALDHPTRIIVVLEGNEAEADVESHEFDLGDREILERLAIFRFGCSRQAAYSMVNFRREAGKTLSWKEFELAVDRLIKDRLLTSGRNTLYVPVSARQMIGDLNLSDDPEAHQHAAQALCPILHPRGVRISGNRDRQLEPENVLEAAWHLQRAYSLVPRRFRPRGFNRGSKPTVSDSQALLTLLRSAPDWDTVVRLRNSAQTLDDGLALSLELFEAQRALTGNEPRSTTLGLYIETLGWRYKFNQQKQDEIDRLADEIVSIVDHALEALRSEDVTPTEWRRRLRHLFSRQVFALRMLGLPLNDSRMTAPKSYIDNAVSEITGKDFMSSLGEDFEGLLDYPISYDFWRCMWSDGKDERWPNKTLTLAERSTYAFAAARANLVRRRPGKAVARPWDEPWIAYLVLTRPEEIAPAQLAGPLMTWWEVYGDTSENALDFGRRVLDMQQHARPPRRNQGWKEDWSRSVLGASSNLWSYVTHPETECRLVGPPVAPALRLINVLALQETITAFQFMNTSGRYWLKHWHRLVLTAPGKGWPAPADQTFGFVADEWAALGRAVVGHKVGWISMLADLKTLPDDSVRLSRVMNWLHAYEATGIDQLHDDDPEKLTEKAQRMPLVADFLRTRDHARSNARAILDLSTNGKPWLEEGHFRDLFSEIVSSLGN
jgi:hypothetical protein